VVQGDPKKLEQLQEAFFYFDEDHCGSIHLVGNQKSHSECALTNNFAKKKDKLREIVQRSGEAMSYQDVCSTLPSKLS